MLVQHGQRTARWASLILIAATSVAMVEPATATYPGTNGRIAFAAYVPRLGHEQIFTIAPDGTDRTMLTHSKFADNINPAWSADGTQLTFERDFARAADIFTIDADGTNVHRVTHFRYSSAPFFSPDGTKILFAQEDPLTHRTGIWTTNVDGTGDPQLVFSDPHPSAVLAFPQYSPDGTKVTFTRYGREGRSAIFIADADGSDVVRLTNWDLGAAAGSFRPDGSMLAFNSYSESILGQSGNIYTIRADGTALVQLTHNDDAGTTNAFGPSWSPDGTQIGFAQAGDVYLMQPDGSDVVQVTSGPLADHNTDWGPHP